MSSVRSFEFLWWFESLAAGAPTEEGKKEQGMQLCQPTEPNASWILSILSHFHASLAIQPRANESHIMSEDRCQKSLNLLASNDLLSAAANFHIRCQSGIVTGCRKSGR